MYRNDLIILPHWYQSDVIQKNHNDHCHQGFNKVAKRTKKQFDWPGLYDTIANWIPASNSFQEAKNLPKKTNFPLKPITSSRINELVHMDHMKLSSTSTGYNHVLVLVDHYTKLAEAFPCGDDNAEQTCKPPPQEMVLEICNTRV